MLHIPKTEQNVHIAPEVEARVDMKIMSDIKECVDAYFKTMDYITYVLVNNLPLTKEVRETIQSYWNPLFDKKNPFAENYARPGNTGFLVFMGLFSEGKKVAVSKGKSETYITPGMQDLIDTVNFIRSYPETMDIMSVPCTNYDKCYAEVYGMSPPKFIKKFGEQAYIDKLKEFARVCFTKSTADLIHAREVYNEELVRTGLPKISKETYPESLRIADEAMNQPNTLKEEEMAKKKTEEAKVETKPEVKPEEVKKEEPKVEASTVEVEEKTVEVVETKKEKPAVYTAFDAHVLGEIARVKNMLAEVNEKSFSSKDGPDEALEFINKIEEEMETIEKEAKERFAKSKKESEERYENFKNGKKSKGGGGGGDDSFFSTAGGILLGALAAGAVGYAAYKTYDHFWGDGMDDDITIIDDNGYDTPYYN